MIVDASVLLSAFFPDEHQRLAQAIIREHITGQIRLKAPDLLHYELCNAVWQAERRKRISSIQADEILQSMQGIGIEIVPLEWFEMFPFARQTGCSAYDAAYVRAAQKLDEPLITADEKLFHAAQPHYPQIILLDDYGKEKPTPPDKGVFNEDTVIGK